MGVVRHLECFLNRFGFGDEPRDERCGHGKTTFFGWM